MYYEEAVIDGVLHFRTTPDGEWISKTAAQLTEALMEARRKQTVVQVSAPTQLPSIVVAPQPVVLPPYQNPQWTVTC